MASLYLLEDATYFAFQTSSTGYTTATYQKILEQNQFTCYILSVDDEPHLIALWGKSRDSEMSEYAELLCIHSLQSRWRMGFGRIMMDTVLRDMKENGYCRVMLWVFEENKRAIGFYENLGFKFFGKVKPNIVPREICYEKEL